VNDGVYPVARDQPSRERYTPSFTGSRNGSHFSNNRKPSGPSPNLADQPRFKWCACCGEEGGHTWETCPHKQTGPEQHTNAPPSVKKFALDLEKLKMLPLDQSMAVVETSVARGNLKYHAATYVLQLKQQLNINNENRKRHNQKVSASTNIAPQTVVIGVCRLAISSSTVNQDNSKFVHTPAIGRNQLVYSNGVLTHAKGKVYAANKEQILRRLKNDTAQIRPPPWQTSYARDHDTTSEVTEQNTEMNTRSTEGESICLIDGGATPSAVTWQLVKDLNIPCEESYQRLDIAGVHGDVKTSSTVCWLQIDFQDMSITIQAIVVDHLSSPVLLGATDFNRYNMAYQPSSKVITFGDHLRPDHVEPVMTASEIQRFPESGYRILHSTI
jgi:hypothetical protein